MTRADSIFVPIRPESYVDRREGGAWTPAQKFKNWLIRLVVKALVRAADAVPAKVLVNAGAAIGQIASLFLVRARRRAEARIKNSLSHVDAAFVARQSFVRAGENLGRCLLLRRPSVRALDVIHVAAPARKALADALEPGRGAVFVSAHLGPFEMIAAAVAELGHRPAVVVRESYDAELDALVDSHRQGRGVTVVHRGSPTAAHSILRALRQGKPVGFLPDLGARVPSIELDFLGDKIPFPIGPQLIALRAGAPIVIGTLKPRAGPGPRYELVIEEVEASPDPLELTQRVASGLERAIRAAPEEWLWMCPPPRRIAD